MKVVLIQQWLLREFMEAPVSLAYIAAYLDKMGIDVSLADLQIKKRLTTEEDIAEVINNLKPDVVGLTCMTSEVNKIKEMAKKIKKINKNIKIVVGGVHATIMPETIINEPFIDYVVIGEGELVFYNLIKSLETNKSTHDIKGIGYKSNGKIIINPREKRIKDIEALPYPYKFYDVMFYANMYKNNETYRYPIAAMFSSRGCPFNCGFCSVKVVWQQIVSFKSPEKLVDEIEYVLNNYDVKGIIFNDSIFGINKDWLRNVCKEITNRKLKFRWYANCRVDLVDIDTLKLMKRAGCEIISFGMESGSQRILDYYNKGTTVEQNIKAAELCNSAGIRAVAQMIIGAPIETKEDIKANIKFIDNVAKNIESIYWNILIPYPGTKTYDDLKKMGYLKNVKWDDFVYDKALFPLKDMSREELNGLAIKLGTLSAAKRNLKQKKFIPRILNRFIKNGPIENTRHLIKKAKAYLQELKWAKEF